MDQPLAPDAENVAVDKLCTRPTRATASQEIRRWRLIARERTACTSSSRIVRARHLRSRASPVGRSPATWSATSSS